MMPLTLEYIENVLTWKPVVFGIWDSAWDFLLAYDLLALTLEFISGLELGFHSQGNPLDVFPYIYLFLKSD